MKNIIVGMSGGVDSAVSAYLLIKKGYSVEAVFMKNWVEDSEYCTSEQDYLDALQVCNMLKIPLRTVNFSKQYWEKVFKIFLSEYKSGRTPNPDILCNTEIKFKEFLKYAIQLGADKMATGHYVRSKLINSKVKIYKGSDDNKDQSYFLYGLNQSQISNAIFPLGNLDKLQVAQSAKIAAEGADAILILTGWDEFKNLNWESIYKVMRKPAWVFDARICLDKKYLKSIGFNVWTVGIS